MDKFRHFLDKNWNFFWNSIPSVNLANFAKFVKTLPKLQQTKKKPKKTLYGSVQIVQKIGQLGAELFVLTGRHIFRIQAQKCAILTILDL
jgi:hypothetical protein